MKEKTIQIVSGALFIIFAVIYASVILFLPLPFVAKFLISVISATAMGMVIRLTSKEYRV